MKDIEAYIQPFPVKVQRILKKIRLLIKKNAPGVEEKIAWGMPGYKFNKKPLLYFAGYKKHIGLYATPAGHRAFKKELTKYKQGKGSVQFPLDRPIPYSLIKKIVQFRVIQNRLK